VEQGEHAGERGRHVVVIGTGGTIASRWQGAGYAAEAPGREVLAAGAVPDGVEVTVRDLFTVNSSRLTTRHQLRLLHAVREALSDPGVDGVVVTHGTDTMEESAFLLDLHHDDRRPVVLTGAQLPLDAPDGDAAGNLYDALLTAATARDVGVVIVFGGLVHAARATVKRHTLDVDAFADPNGGPIGRVRFGEVTWSRHRPRAAERPATLPPPPAELLRDGSALPRVDVVAHHVDADPALFEAALAAGAAGVVLEGTGAGNATPDFVAAVRRAVRERGTLVAVSTRVAAGPVAALYTGGGAVDLVAAGAVLTGTLRAGQARIAVLAALLAEPAADRRPEALARLVGAAGADPPVPAHAAG
jgi:L-asparaginase